LRDGEIAKHRVNDAQTLTAIRAVHTAIYVLMAAAIFVLTFAGITGQTGMWLWVALTLVAIENLVFAGCGFKCPLTVCSVHYGAETGKAFETFLPESVTRHTF
jgi:hypothetical protein